MKEEDIRKREVFNQYLTLVEKDVEKLFNNASSYVQINCPACSSVAYKQEFIKTGFNYVSCNKCHTLFVNPRPTFKDLMKFYAESESTGYWIREFFTPVAEVRREKMFKPRAEYVISILPEKKDGLIGDIGAGFGIFLEELKLIWPDANLVAIEPSDEQAALCEEKGFTVLHCALEEVTGYDQQFDLLSSFEVFEHLFDPHTFLEHIFLLLKPGGSFYMTTLNGEGFDIQIFWEESKSINPPLHLNFFNPESIELLFKRCGFKDIKVTTPGKLDWDIVEGMLNKEGFTTERFWHLLADKGSDSCKQELQQWLTKNNLSSHMKVIASK